MHDAAKTGWVRVLRGGLSAALALVFATPHETARAGKPAEPPVLDTEHKHPSGVFTFRTPAGWKVEPVPENPDTVNLGGDGVLLRFVYHAGENGLDSLHGACMVERLAPAMDMAPAVKYEYDFIGGVVANRRALDSAFIVRYDQPIFGERQWRQRNVTIVGDGDSLCAITYAPLALWKKSAPARALLDAVLGSVTFR
ncbi:MAG TPA: hypothetical protein VMR21_07860 [Vicinamibacteria bacterium]|nr:hypothetical protein [Vicinamibacteria bacterium]